jgi:hypothetical protein
LVTDLITVRGTFQYLSDNDIEPTIDARKNSSDKSSMAAKKDCSLTTEKEYR